MKRHSLKILFSLMTAALMAGSVALGGCGQEDHTEHVYGAWEEVVPAGCEENGTRRRVCTLPGCTHAEEEDIPALGHAWGLSKVTVAATCQHGGKRTKTCANCGETVTEDTDPIDHDWEPTKIIKQATCKEGGREEQQCSMCGITQTVDTKAREHDWGTPLIEEPATCKAPGKSVKICQYEDCGEKVTEVIPQLNHLWKNTKVLQPATCEDDGQQEQTCQRPGCGETQTVTITRLGHSWQDYYTIDKQPSFQQAGSKSYHCNRCGAHQQDVTIPKLEENTPIVYEFRAMRNTGKLMTGTFVTIVVKDAVGTEVARSTPSTFDHGVFSVELLPKTYTVTLENIPAGYTAASEYSVTPFDPYCNVYLTAAPIDGSFSGKYKEGDVMYDFNISDDDTTVHVGSLKELLQSKKMVLLNFWYANCSACDEEFRGLDNAYTKYKDDVEVLAINCPQASYNETGSLKEITSFGLQKSLSFPLVRNAAVGLASAFSVTLYPTSVVIDAEGVICGIYVRAMQQNEFEAIFAQYSADDYLRTFDAEEPAMQIVRAEALPAEDRKNKL